MKVLVAILVVLVIIISPFVLFPIYNNMWLNHLSKELLEHSLPEQTKYIEQKSICGKLNGNGNGMNFFSCILIKSNLSLPEIEEHYKKKIILSINKKYKAQIGVITTNGHKIEIDYLENRDVYLNSLKNVRDYDGYYIVFVYDGGYWGGLDIRAN